METFVVVLHLIVAFVLIGLVLIQDSKGGGLGGTLGGGTSSSLLGATGAATLAQKATRWTGLLFAGTCIALSIFASSQKRSVVDGAVVPPAAPAASAPATPAPETTPTTPPAQNP